MSEVTNEYNYKRKSHRVDIPLLIDIEGEIYQAKDWSITGVGIRDLNREMQPGELLPVRLSLPMNGTTVTLQVTLAFRNHVHSVWGFEFHELDTRHKRMLRHYIEMAIEGRIENIEDLIAVATAPVVTSPIEDALNLTDLEQDSLTKQFKAKSKFSITVGLLFLLTVIIVLFYNTTYRVRAIGVIAGNTVAVTANHNGYIDKIFVETGRKVKQGDPLIALSLPNLNHKRAALLARLQSLENQFGEPAYNNGTRAISSNLLATLQAIEKKRRAAFDSAKVMFDEHVITKKDLDYMENRWSQALKNLQREQQNLQRKSPVKRSDGSEGDFKVAMEILQTRQQIALIDLQGEQNIITAPADGVVYSIDAINGTSIRDDHIVAVIANDKQPFAIMSISNEDMLKLHLNQAARVYIPALDQEVPAKIVAFGHQAVKTDFSLSHEMGLKRTLVKLKLLQAIKIPPFSRIEVWVQTFNWTL